MKLFLVFIFFISNNAFAQDKSKAEVKKVAPVAQVKPVAPIKPVEPVAPVAPVTPVVENIPAPVEEPQNRLSLEGWQFRATVGLDFQVSNSGISPQGSYSDPDDEAEVGGAVGFFARRYISPNFAMTTGGEFVSRKLTQDYDIWFVTLGGETRYDIVSFEVPIYFELIMGSGKHSLYMGPKLATPLYDHCNDDIENATAAYPCMQDAASSFFVPFQFGYNLRLGNGLFGLTIFMERTLTKIIDKQDLEVDAFRTGAHASFYF